MESNLGICQSWVGDRPIHSNQIKVKSKGIYRITSKYKWQRNSSVNIFKMLNKEYNKIIRMIQVWYLEVKFYWKIDQRVLFMIDSQWIDICLKIRTKECCKISINIRLFGTNINNIKENSCNPALFLRLKGNQ